MRANTRFIYRFAAATALIAVLIPATGEASNPKETFFKERHIPLDGEGVNLTFSFKAFSRCMFGDRDAIALDMFKSPEGYRLLLSVEPIAEGDSSMRPETEEIQKKFIRINRKIKLRLPYFEEPTLLGVFICKDTGEDGHCSDKPVIDINKVLKNHAPNSKQGGIIDKTYFFQPILLERNTVKTVAWGKIGKDTNKLWEVLREISKESNGFTEDSIAKLFKIDNTLQSQMQSNKRGELKIIMPYYSKKKCGGRRK